MSDATDAIVRARSPFGRINWDSPDAVRAEGAPRVVAPTGTVVTFGCGCPSWATYPDGSPVDPADALADLQQAAPERWADAQLVRYRREAGRLLAEDGTPLPTSCTHGDV